MFFKYFPRRLTIFFVGIVLALIFSEVFLRIFWNPPYLDPQYKRDDFSWMSKNVILNNFGYRDKDTSIVKPVDKLRIYSLGDSFTYGWYINDSNLSYPNVLETELNEWFGTNKVEVINAANPGFKIQDSLERFRTEGVLFSPDIVTLGINLFDITNKEFPPKKPKFLFLGKLKLYQLTFGNAERIRVARLTESELTQSIKKDSEQIKNTRKLIEEFGRSVSKEGATLIIVVFPEYDPSNPNKRYPYEDFHYRIKEIVSDINKEEYLNIKVVDLLEAMSSVPDKNTLVLNPTDNHPTIEAHKIAAAGILEEFDFNNFVATHKSVLNTPRRRTMLLGESLGEFKGIIGLAGSGNKWVYFDRIFDLGVQKRVLENTGERKVPFMIDFLKTAKSLTHDGWPGAKLELNFLGSAESLVDKHYLGYEIVGVHQATVFGRENGSTFSENLDLSDVEIKKDNQNIRIKILAQRNYDFYRVSFDVAVRQMDIDNGQIVSFFETAIKETTVKRGDLSFHIPAAFKVSSLPVFVGSRSNYNYIWYGDTLKRVKLTKKGDGIEGEINLPIQDNVTIEIPVAEEFKGNLGPTVIYL